MSLRIVRRTALPATPPLGSTLHPVLEMPLSTVTISDGARAAACATISGVRP